MAEVTEQAVAVNRLEEKLHEMNEMMLALTQGMQTVIKATSANTQQAPTASLAAPLHDSVRY